MADELFEMPADLTLLSNADVEALEATAVAEFDRVRAIEEVTPDLVAYQIRLTDDLDKIRIEAAGRRARAAETAARAQANLLQKREELSLRVHGPTNEDGTPVAPVANPAVDTAQIAQAAAEGVTAALFAAMDTKRNTGGGFTITEVRERATASLAAARQHQPAQQTTTTRLAVTAGIDIPGVARGSEMATLEDVTSAFQKAAKSMPVTRDGTGREVLVATIRNEYEHVIDDRTSPSQVEELFRYLTQPSKQEALVAGGGWCAPSEIRYGFFNVACSDGLVDLPTVGITRGGIRFPVSPSMADALYGPSGASNFPGFGGTFSNASDPWLWTETDDIATVTGSPNKPTMRVPCPTFSEARLECYGITMTAGNLTDDAYPEATSNTLRLLHSAWSHAQNARILSQMVALSTVSVTGGGFANPSSHGAFNQVLSGLALAATDYRAKYSMCEEDVLEVVAPFWLADVIVADLAWRTNVDKLSVSEGQITSYFSDRQLRVQWVNDWQVRGATQFGNPTTPMTSWPASAQVMLYAAGTFLKGNGLTLDLGVVRDSVLNAENDFTAAWAEECHLVAKIGHESRLYTIAFNVSGAAMALAASAATNL